MERQTSQRQAYTTDVTNEQWSLIEKFLPPVLPWGRPRRYAYREIVNAIFYVVRTGCQWRNLPHDLPPWSLVHYYYHQWRKDGTWQKIHDALVKQTRNEMGREETPSAGVIDTQSVKTTERGGSKAMTLGSR